MALRATPVQREERAFRFRTEVIDLQTPSPGASQRKSVSRSEKAAREKNIATQRIKGFGGENPVLPESPPASMSSVMKNNPLYGDVSLEDAMEERKKNPSWTIEEYDKHSVRTNLSGHLKENPNDLRFWLGDMYTPGFDTLLKKKKKRNKRSKLCHMGLILLLVSCILVTIVTLSTIFS
ncbi:major intrinsically disordered NOTCH2-binding receptor 1-like isoform X3 [Arvicanthis niloticus]|uniref:major intrinsically disordered NOTCH2-binding receptor 1-like isoform X3 n=1 Tax=Arvicanthis niloticus TaxID=61156 RepID=UPI00402B25C7